MPEDVLTRLTRQQRTAVLRSTIRKLLERGYLTKPWNKSQSRLLNPDCGIQSALAKRAGVTRQRVHQLVNEERVIFLAEQEVEAQSA